MTRKTHVSIVEDQFFINGEPTYKGVTWQGHKIEGLLMNTRMVQGIFVFRMIGPLGLGLVDAIRQFASNANRLTTFRINEMMVTYVRKFEEQGKRDKAAAVYKLAILFESSGAVVAFGIIPPVLDPVQGVSLPYYPPSVSRTSPTIRIELSASRSLPSAPRIP